MEISKSLERLSSGLRINSAADDSAGMQIANTLRSQANAFGQAIKNANDALGISKIADKAMEEQIKIMEMIKVKAIQAAQDTQSVKTRRALQNDIQRLIDEVDNIALGTSYNSKNLLAGAFSNQEFQIGAYSHESVKTTFASTLANKIGNTRFETSQHIGWDDAGDVKFTTHANRLNLAFIIDDRRVQLESVVLSTSSGTGIGSVVNTINKNSDSLGGIRASWTNTLTLDGPIISGAVTGLVINGENIGDISLIENSDKNGSLMLSINEHTAITGVQVTQDVAGTMSFRSLDGRGIDIQALTGFGVLNGDRATADDPVDFGSAGRITLRKYGATDIIISMGNFGTNVDLENMGFNAQAGRGGVSASEGTVNLQDAVNGLTDKQIDAVGLYSNAIEKANGASSKGAGVLTLRSAMTLIDVVETALINLDTTRSEIGSTQKHLSVAITNLASAQVNVIASESQIRDVNFSIETAKFNKSNILAQAGSYALTQANQLSNLAIQVLKGQ
jgi:flagellin